MKSFLQFITLILFLSSVNFVSADEHGRLYYRDLDENGLQDYLARLPDSPSNKCARGVRLSLNALFRGGPANGKNALEYNEAVLSQWQTEDYRYKKLGDTKKFKNFDVKVLLPAQTCPEEAVRKYGHIEFRYKGVWYSDFRQRGSAYDGDLALSKRDPNYKRCYSRQVIYRLMPKE